MSRLLLILSLLINASAHAQSYAEPEEIKLKDEKSLDIAFSKTFTSEELLALKKSTQIELKCYLNRHGEIINSFFEKKNSLVLDSLNCELLKLNVIKYCKYEIPATLHQLGDSLRYVYIMYCHR